MPPKEIVATGPKQLSQTAFATRKRRDFLVRPTTSRALILRNGKHGAIGTGELMALRKKLSGKEKLDLLAGMNKRWSVAISNMSLQQRILFSELYCPLFVLNGA